MKMELHIVDGYVYRYKKAARGAAQFLNYFGYQLAQHVNNVWRIDRIQHVNFVSSVGRVDPVDHVNHVTTGGSGSGRGSCDQLC